ncbi:hypothetical protein IMCC3135_06375 [Granulosicoccus antarcticus IMCC3135]|uniref:J domain-containing protein n=1 Tax=Granulosicoccus antarcticus IMCC3135 TaxID=1192854 RepID=A0A2Z2NJ35_9GAMM|nr:hypothetical protein IMCC3135_06375 [Granulosicoccus antarcticus IMCC3135]
MRLWEAIRLTRDELSQWRQQAEQVDSLFRLHILPRETRFTGVYSALSNRLMDHYEQARLSGAQQALLALWITDNLRALSAHPFLAPEQREALVQRWQHVQVEESSRTGADLQSKSSRTSGSSYTEYDEDDELDDDDVVFDFGWHKTAPARDDQDRDDSLGNAKTDHHTDKAPSGDQPPLSDEDLSGNDGQADNDALDVDAKVSELEQRLSIDRLFRQLARVLHPDLEQDDTLKAEKHELMSQCLQARQNKDINTLLTLYCEHIGDLPDDLSPSDHDDLIKALQQQLRQLQNELRQERFADPLRVQIIERYSDGDETQILQRIMRHAESLDAETELLNTQLSELDSDGSLEQALEVRREIELDRMVINQMTGYTR